MEVIIVGAGGYGREIAYVLSRLKTYHLLAFVDDKNEKQNTMIHGTPVIGSIDYLLTLKKKTAVAIGIGKPEFRRKCVERLADNPNLVFPNFIDPTALIGETVTYGQGNVFMPYSICMTDSSLGDFNMVNVHTTIGHDTTVGNYNSFYPNVNISGYAKIGDENELGAGTTVIPEITIEDHSIIGAGSTVIRRIESCTKQVGTPTRIIERWKSGGIG